MKWRSLPTLFITSFTVITLGLLVLFSQRAGLAEAWYGHGIYPVMRRVLTIIPWPTQGLIISLGVMILALMILILRCIFPGKWLRWRRVLHVGVYLWLVVAAFYWCWGYNYARPTLPDRLGVVLSDPDSAWLFHELEQSIDRLNALCDQAESEGSNWEASAQERLHEYVIQVLGYHEMGKPSLTHLRPEGGLLRWSTAGIYWPYTGQPHVDAGLHQLTLPATQLHEWAHAYGVTSEADCNYIAYEVARGSDHALVAYSGERLWHRHLIRACLTVDQYATQDLLQRRDARIAEHTAAIRRQHDQYGRWMPDLRDQVYDTFLKVNQVDGGIKSYGYIVRLRYALDRAGK